MMMKKFYFRFLMLLLSIVSVIITTAPSWGCEGPGCPVVPEPVSTTLFIAGGAVLMVRRYMKRKK